MTCRLRLPSKYQHQTLFLTYFSIELLLFSLELLVQKYCIITSLLLLWCSYMVINVSVQCNGGLLPDIILLTLCDSIGAFQYHVEFLSLQPIFPPKPSDY